MSIVLNHVQSTIHIDIDHIIKKYPSPKKSIAKYISYSYNTDALRKRLFFIENFSGQVAVACHYNILYMRAIWTDTTTILY